MLYRCLMGVWIWGLLVLLFQWLWGIRWLIATIVWFIWFQWTIKNTVRDGVSEALNKTVVPVLEEIRDALTEDE